METFKNLETFTMRILIENTKLDHSSPKMINQGYFKTSLVEPRFLVVQYGRGCTRETAIKNAIETFEYTFKTKIVSFDITDTLQLT